MAGLFMTSTFRILGSAATPQNLFTLTNTDATKLIYLRRLIVLMDTTAVLVSFQALLKASRVSGAVPSGGTTLTKTSFRYENTSNANTIALGANALNAGAATAITATAGIATIWQQYASRVHTHVGQVLGFDMNVLPQLIDTQSFILRQNQAILVQVVAPSAVINPATNHYIVNCVWEEN